MRRALPLLLALLALAAAPPAYLDPALVARLVADLASEDLATRRAAMAALERLGPACLDGLTPAMTHPDPDVRLRAFVVRRAVLPVLAPAEVALKGHTSGIVCLSVSADGTLAVTGGTDQSYRVWDLRRGEPVTEKTIGGNVWGVSLTPEGKQVLVGTQGGTLALHDLKTGAVVRSWPKYAKAVRSVAVLPDGKRAVTAHYDNFVRVHDLTTGKELLQMAGHAGGQLSLAVSADGASALTGGGQKEGVAIRWDLKANKLAHRLAGHGERMLGVAFSADGATAATACWDGKVRLWLTRTGALRHTLDAGGAVKVYSVAFSGDGRHVAAGTEKGEIKVWRVGEQAVTRTLTGHTDAVTNLAFLPDARLVSTGRDGLVRVWAASNLVAGR